LLLDRLLAAGVGQALEVIEFLCRLAKQCPMVRGIPEHHRVEYLACYSAENLNSELPTLTSRTFWQRMEGN